MKPFKTKFKRIETKYVITKTQWSQLQSDWQDLVETNEYAASTIANLYYDTPTYQLIRQSLEKPNYKEKLRVRSYQPCATATDAVFIEVKKKFQKVVYKRRMQTDLAQATQWLASVEEPLTLIDASQVAQEIQWLRQRYPDLAPAMYIYYDRMAYQGKLDSSIRITVDSNLVYRDYDLDLAKGVYGAALLAEDKMILEVKVSGAYPLWLSQSLAKHQIFKSSFSKYGVAYQQVKQRGGVSNDQFAI